MWTWAPRRAIRVGLLVILDCRTLQWDLQTLGGRGTLRDVKRWNDVPLLAYHTSGVVVGTALGGEGARHSRCPK